LTLSPTGILCWKWFRNVSRWKCWYLFNVSLSSTEVHQEFDEW